MFQKFSEDAKKVLMNAKKEMQELKHPYVGSEHVMLAILSNKNNEYVNRLKKYNTSFDVIVNNFTKNIQFLKNVVAAYGNIEDRISNSTDNVLNN